MKPFIAVTLLVSLAWAGSANAGRMTSCDNLPNGFFDPLTQQLSVPGVDVLGDQFDIQMDLLPDPPLLFQLEAASPTPFPGPPGGIYHPSTNSAFFHCVDVDGFFYWGEFPIQSNEPLLLGLSDADLVRDLSDTTLNLPLMTGPSQLQLGPNGQATLDNSFSGTWDQTGNDLLVSIEGGLTIFDLQVGPGGISGQGNHFNQTTNLSQIHPEADSILLNNNRFRVEVDWRGTDMPTPATAHPVRNSDSSGIFWFFDSSNTELLVKVLDGCATNDRFWVFYGATTNVEFTLRVTDTQESVVYEQTNPLGQPFTPIMDTEAFATCP